MHGEKAVVEEILDWRPYDYLTLTTLVPVPDAPKVPMSYAFIEQGNGTKVEIRLSKPKPKDEALFDKIVGNFKEHITHEVDVLKGILKERLEATPAVEEPPMPPALEWFPTAAG